MARRRPQDSAILRAIDAADKPPAGAVATISGRRFRKLASGGWRRIGEADARRYVVRKCGLAMPGEFLQPGGGLGPRRTARRFASQDVADRAGRAAFGDNFGIF